jgi:hypothetical protein
MTLKPLFKPFVTNPLAPIIAGMIIHFMLHIRCVSLLKYLCLGFFYATLCLTLLSGGIATLSTCRFCCFQLLYLAYFSNVLCVFSLLLLLLLLLRLACLIQETETSSNTVYDKNNTAVTTLQRNIRVALTALVLNIFLVQLTRLDSFRLYATNVIGEYA